MTNKELIEKIRTTLIYKGEWLNREDALNLCDRLEAKELEFNRMENAWRGEVEKERARLGREIDRLKGLIRWVKGWIEHEEWRNFPAGEEKQAIEQIMGEG